MPADGTNAAVKSQDIGTSGWQLADKATLLARIGKAGGAMSPPGTEETIHWAAGMTAYRGKAAVPLGSQIVSR